MFAPTSKLLVPIPLLPCFPPSLTLNSRVVMSVSMYQFLESARVARARLAFAMSSVAGKLTSLERLRRVELR